MLRLKLLFFCFWGIMTGYSQQHWSLNKCLEYAKNKNLQIKQSRLTEEAFDSKLQTVRRDILPTVNGGFLPSYYFGRTIDPTTYQFVNKGLLSNNFYLSTLFTLYSGGKKKNLIEQAVVEKEIAKTNTSKLVRDISVLIIQNYIQILIQEDQLRNAKELMNISKQQLEKLKRSNSNEGIDIWEAQVAMDDLAVIRFQNELQISKLSLSSLLDLPNQEDFEIEPLNFSPKLEEINLEKPEFVYQKIAVNAPQLKTNFLQERLYSLQLENTRSSQSPVLSFFANAMSYYSSAFKDIDKITITGYDTTLFYANKKVQLGLSPRYDYQYSTIPYFAQLGKTLYINVGLNLSIPIFNGYQHKNTIIQARINQKNIQYTAQINRNELKKEVYQLYANLQSAIKQYEAAQKSQIAWKKAFDNSLKKLQENPQNLGDFDTVKNNYHKAEESFQLAKYDFILKKLILDIYQNQSQF